MAIRASSKDVVWSYAGTIFMLLSRFIILPFILFFLSPEEVGLWYIFLAISSITVLFELGFNPTFGRNIAYSWSGAQELIKEGCVYSDSKEPNFKLLKVLIETCKLLYGLLALVILLLVSTLGTIYLMYVSLEMEGVNHLISWAIFCIAISTNLYFGYFSALLRGIGAVDKKNRATIISNACQILVTVILLFLGLGLIGMSIGFLINGLLLRLICKRYFNEHKSVNQGLKNIEKPSKKEIIDTYKIVSLNAYREGAVAFASFISGQATAIIVSLFFSLSEVAIFSISLQFANAIAKISGTIIVAYQPTLQSAHIVRNRIREITFVSKGIFMYYLLYPLGVLGVVFVAFPFLGWVGDSIEFNVSLFLGLAFYTFLLKQHSIFATFIVNTNRMPYVKAFCISSILGVIITLILLKTLDLGIWAVIIGQFVVQLSYNNWYWPRYRLKELDTSLLNILKLGFLEWKEVIKQKRTKYFNR